MPGLFQLDWDAAFCEIRAAAAMIFVASFGHITNDMLPVDGHIFGVDRECV